MRPPGFFGSNEGDHFHVEEGGEEGTIVLLSMTAVDGVIWELFDDDGQMVAVPTFDEFKGAFERQFAAAPVSASA